jgi:hypothetical protein
MEQFPIPKNDDDSSKNRDSFDRRSKEPKGKMPDFIILDDTHDYIHGNYRKSNSSQKRQQPRRPNKLVQNRFLLRLFCLLGMMLSFLVAIGMLIWTTLVFIVAALLFFKNQVLNQSLTRFWNFYIHSSVVALTLGIATISPTLGIGLLVVYFSMQSEGIDTHFVKNVLKRLFNIE